LLHAEIAKVASEVVGLDVAAHEMEPLGYHAVLGDAENILASKLGLFDVIVAGGLIEHLERRSFPPRSDSRDVHLES
jgi:hypothetical protein